MVEEIFQPKPLTQEISVEIEKVRRSIWHTILRIAEIATSAAPVLCIVAAVIAQVLNTWHNPFQDPISSLVWGSYGGIQTAAFYLLGFSVLILAVKLFPRAKSKLLKAGLVVLGLTGIGMVMVGIFPAGRLGFPNTIINDIHLQTSTILIFLFPISCFIMAPRIKGIFSRRGATAYTWITGAVGIILIFIEASLVLPGIGWMGTVERLEILNGIVWVQTMTIMSLKRK